MLTILRKKESTKKIIFWILVVVCVFAFVLWGVGTYKHGSYGPNYAGAIFGKKISLPEFRKIHLGCLNDVRLRFGEKYREILKYIDLNNQAWIKLILLEHAKKIKIKVSDQEVIQEITTSPLFNRDGKFRKDIYIRMLRYFLGTQPRDFEEQTRINLTIRKLYERQTKDIKLSDDEILKAYKEDNEETSVDYIKVKKEDFLKEINPKDEELNDFYKKNSQLFLRPETINVEYIGIDYAQDAKDEDKEKAFRELNSLYKKIKNAKEFKSLAKKPFSVRESGFFALNEPIKDIGYDTRFSQAAFNLKEKEISPIVKTQKGVYVLRILQKKESYTPELKDIKEKVFDALKLDKAEGIAKEKIQKYKNEIQEYISKKKASNLKSAAKKLNIESKSTEMFKRKGDIPEIGSSKEFKDAAFSLKQNQISDVVKTPLGYFILEQNKFSSIDEEKFKKEKEEFRQKLLDTKKQEAFNTLTEDLFKQSNLKDFSYLIKFEE